MSTTEILLAVHAERRRQQALAAAALEAEAVRERERAAARVRAQVPAQVQAAGARAPAQVQAAAPAKAAGGRVQGNASPSLRPGEVPDAFSQRPRYGGYQATIVRLKKEHGITDY